MVSWRRPLPVLPVPRTQAVLVLRNPDASVDDLVAVVEGDPALTAQLIRAANAAFSAPVAAIATARQAVVRIGVNDARRLMGTVVLEEQLRELDAGPVDTEELWRYTIATAVLAEAALGGGASGEGERADSPERGLAFTAGLLHDIGRLAFLAESPSRFAAVQEAVRAGAEPLAAERARFGMSHTDAGLEIARTWSLPPALEAAASLHHASDADGIVGAVATACRAALHAGFTDGLLSGLAEEPSADVLALLDRVGGVPGLAGRIRWYRNASRGQ